MVKAGLYADGSDPELDQAIKIWGELDGFLAEEESVSAQNSFARLSVLLRRAGTGRPGTVQTTNRPETRSANQPARRTQ